jgi:hypothetical protein
LVVAFACLCTGLDAFAQSEEFAETPAAPAEEALPTADIEVETDNALWTPSLFTGSGGTLSEFLQGGKLNWGIEFLNLKSDSDGSFETDVAGNRFSLGWETAKGTGLRGQYLTYGQDWFALNSSMGTQVTPSNYDPSQVYDYLMAYEHSYLMNQELDYATLDIYQRFSLGQTQLLLGIGPSYAQIDSVFQNVFDTGAPGGEYSYDYSDESLRGTGGSIVGDLKHPLVVRDSWELSFLLNGRSAYVPVDLTLRSLVISADMDDDVWIHSYGTGLELLKRFRNYSVLLRGQFEGQHWEGSLVEQEFTGTSFSVGLGW